MASLQSSTICLPGCLGFVEVFGMVLKMENIISVIIVFYKCIMSVWLFCLPLIDK